MTPGSECNFYNPSFLVHGFKVYYVLYIYYILYTLLYQTSAPHMVLPISTPNRRGNFSSEPGFQDKC